MTTENEIVRVKTEIKIIRGINVITIRPDDDLVVIGESNFGEVVCRFADCADTEALHDAFFGKFYIDPKNIARQPKTLEISPL